MVRLLLLFGGQSSEHAVSCTSASVMIPFIDRDRFDVMLVGITKKGEWFLTEASPEEIASGQWEASSTNQTAFLSPNRGMKGLQVIQDGALTSRPVDVVFPVMHGELCEDGAIQGLLELCGIPYVGPNICASACCMDKTMTKQIVAASRVRQAQYAVVMAHEMIDQEVSAAIRVEGSLGEYPFFVKPASAGSSVGVSKCHNREELLSGLRAAALIDHKILIEENIVGREVEVAVLGNSDPKASVVGEILAANDFYDYNAKYENNASRTIVPADIPSDSSEKLRRAAVTIYKALGCEGMSRVDFFLLPNGDIVFNEINTIPGFTNISMYPKLWEATGIPYVSLLSRLCDLAMERGCKMPAQ